MAMRPQSFGIGVAVDARDGQLARGIDRRDDRDIRVIETFGELLEGVAQGGCSDAAAPPPPPAHYKPDAPRAGQRQS